MNNPGRVSAISGVKGNSEEWHTVGTRRKPAFVAPVAAPVAARVAARVAAAPAAVRLNTSTKSFPPLGKSGQIAPVTKYPAKGKLPIEAPIEGASVAESPIASCGYDYPCDLGRTHPDFLPQLPQAELSLPLPHISARNAANFRNSTEMNRGFTDQNKFVKGILNSNQLQANAPEFVPASKKRLRRKNRQTRKRRLSRRK